MRRGVISLRIVDDDKDSTTSNHAGDGGSVEDGGNVSENTNKVWKQS